MKNKEFNRYMEYVRTCDSDGESLNNLAHAVYLLLDMTDRQISILAHCLAEEKGYPVVDGRLTIAQPKPHKVVVFGICELTL